MKMGERLRQVNIARQALGLPMLRKLSGLNRKYTQDGWEER